MSRVFVGDADNDVHALHTIDRKHYSSEFSYQDQFDYATFFPLIFIVELTRRPQRGHITGASMKIKILNK